MGSIAKQSILSVVVAGFLVLVAAPTAGKAESAA